MVHYRIYGPIIPSDVIATSFENVFREVWAPYFNSEYWTAANSEPPPIFSVFGLFVKHKRLFDIFYE
jgi:hypothetical protein